MDLQMEKVSREKWIMHYSSNHKILLVGEGDFSFAACLATAFGTAANMVAISLDSREMLSVKYSIAMTNLTVLEELGCIILHEVNARSMSRHYLLETKEFDRIVFNFPHAGFFDNTSESSSWMIKQHQDLVKYFLINARQMLAKDGEVHITHKTAHPFCTWDLEKLALKVRLVLLSEVPFDKYCYPVYENKKGDGYRCDDSFPVGLCSTFKFGKYKA